MEEETTKLSFTLGGQVPAQKNSKTVAYNRATGKPFIMSNDNVRVWKVATAYDIPAGSVIHGSVEVEITLWNKDARKRDIDNMATSILDLLKNNGVIDDDNCFIVKKLIVIFGGVDREQPRAEINIKSIDRP